MHIYEMVNKSPWVSKRRLNEEIIEWLDSHWILWRSSYEIYDDFNDSCMENRAHYIIIIFLIQYIIKNKLLSTPA